MNFHDNLKNKNRKIDFPFDSAHCTSFMKIEAKLKAKPCPNISLLGTGPFIFIRCSQLEWFFRSWYSKFALHTKYNPYHHYSSILFKSTSYSYWCPVCYCSMILFKKLFFFSIQNFVLIGKPAIVCMTLLHPRYLPYLNSDGANNRNRV